MDDCPNDAYESFFPHLALKSNVGVGGLLPALLLAAGLVSAATVPAGPILAGVAMLAGGLIAKIALIQKAAFWVDLFDRHEENRIAAQGNEKMGAYKPAAAAA